VIIVLVEDVFMWCILGDTACACFTPVMLREQLNGGKMTDEYELGLLKHAPDAFFRCSVDGKIIYANKQALKLSGYSKSQLLKLNIKELFTDEILKKHPLRYDLLRQGELVKTERLLTTKKGTQVPVEMHSGMMPDGSLQSFMRDITERKQKEQALRDSEKRYRELFEKSDDAILIIENKQFVDCNNATVRMLRYKNKKELLDTHPSQLSPERQPDGSLSYQKANEMMRIAFDKGFHRFEWYHKRADGGVFPVEVLLTAVSKEGDKQVLHTVWRDITERKQAQEKLFHAQKMDSIGILAGGVAHDFNNMLAGIMGFAGVLKAKESDPRKIFALDGIIQAASRAAELTKKLLGFARKGKHLVQAVNLNHVVGEVFGLLGHSIDKSIELKTEFEVNLFTIDADPSQIHQVVMNLCVNAGHAMPNGGVLSAGTRNLTVGDDFGEGCEGGKSGERVELTIADTGYGMNEETKKMAFEPFFTTKEDGSVKGTGLGLATVYGIVKNHGGTIDIQSEIGKGTRVVICLPRGRRGDVVRSESSNHMALGHGCILVVEDEDIVENMARSMLETMGYSVLTACDGLEGVRIFEERHNEIDGVLLDMKMPRMDGKEAFSRMKAINPSVKVLVSTGYGLNEEAQSILDAGAFGLVPKPYQMLELSLALKKMFE